MNVFPRRCTRWLVISAVLAALASPRCALAVTPDSPDVKAVIKKALKYLETAESAHLGGKCLVAMAFLKDGADENHPRVVAAVEACRAVAAGDAASINTDIYSNGIAIIFLCTLNPSKYNPEIVKYRDALEGKQKSHGGWGYPDKPSGDTSMTQYGLLAFWEMSAVGIPINIEAVEKVADWLIRTQDPNGNWGYQGIEANALEKLALVKQDTTGLGMTAAGLGSTYMAANLLGFTDFFADVDATLPAAIRALKKGQNKGIVTNKVDPKLLKLAQGRGRSWLLKNYKIDPPGFTHYYMYALERCNSFIEASVGRPVKEPTWYNDGFEFLKRTQLRDGSWKGTEGLDAVNTAFGALFLLRSTKKAIERSKSFGDGSLLAGRGLPTGVKQVRVRGGQIAPKQVDTGTKELIDIASKPNDGAFASVVADVELLCNRLREAKGAERQ